VMERITRRELQVDSGAGRGDGLSGCGSDREPALQYLELRPVAGTL